MRRIYRGAGEWGRFVVACAAAFVALAVAGPASASTLMSTDLPKAIPDCEGPNPCDPGVATSTLTVPSGVGAIVDLDVVGLQLNHEDMGDLEITLTSPSATTLTLMSGVCDGTALTDADVFALDASASEEIGSTCPPGTGTYVPAPGDLSTLVGEPSAGTWTLTVTDSIGGGVRNPPPGMLKSWGIRLVNAAQTFTVTNTNNSGAGSLRQAITDANANGARDRIHFNIPGPGPHTIAAPTDLPWVTDSAVVDGRTQPGYAGAPRVAIDGETSTGSHRMFKATAPNTVVRGLAFVGALGPPVEISGNGSVFAGNYVGVLPDGVTAKENGAGIVVGGADVTIGGTSPSDRNVISGGFYASVHLGGVRTKLLGNRIGTNAAGTAAAPAAVAGVLVDDGEDLTIGAPGAGNLISGHGIGVFVQTGGTNPDVRIRGNRIGTNAAGTAGIPNGTGVLFDAGLFGGDPGPVAPGTVVGGLTPGAGNLIAFNSVGVSVVGEPTDVPIRGNSIFSNAGLGIDLEQGGVTLNDALDADDGGNGLQNFPRIRSVKKGTGGTTIRGSLASKPATAYRIDFYGSPRCNPSGFGEGKTYLGTKTVTTNSQGTAAFTKTVASRRPGFVTATATGPNGATSEFSFCSPIYVVNSAADDADADTNDYACRTAGGKCTLRAAIAQANVRPGRDCIRVAIPGGGVKTLEPQSALPDVTDALVLEGTSRGTPRVVLDGRDAGDDVDGLRAVGGPLVVRGLGVTRFDGAGVAVVSGRGSAIQGNAIRSNGGLGIDHGDDGVTLNDPRDRDGGPNGRQNYPVLSGATRNGSGLTVSGTLGSRPNRSYRLEFFSSPSCDPAQVGEGAKYLGATTVRTNGAGAAGFSKTLAKIVPVGHVVTATATGGRDGTSEFSVCRAVRRAGG